ncbi:MAG: response regulator, partial [Pseudomonadota bacterium]
MEKTDILIVDDKPGNLIAMEALLEDEDTNIVKAESGNAALGLLLEHDFALVILDIQMPEMDGIETARIMRKNKQTSQIPIVFVTAINKEEHHIFEGYNAGAVDYIFKPFEPLIFKSK